MFTITYTTFGTTVYYPVPWEGIVIPSTVVEVDDVYANPADPKGNAWWHYTNATENYVSVPTDAVDKNGWHVYERRDPSCLVGLKPVNQFIWIDEPVGHAIQIGDDCFLTLQEALSHVPPSSKKRLKVRLQRYRRYIHNFVASTWERNGERHPGFDKLPAKKVYVHG